MGTGAKVAIGCGCVLLLGGAAVVGLVGMGAWWAKDRLTEAAGGIDRITARADEISRWEEKANANDYVAPADGVIPEARFLGFLETRKRVYALYARHEAELRELAEKAKGAGDKVSPSDLWSAGGTLAEMAGAIRLEQMKALADVGMSEEEYRAIQIAVYKSAWASDAEKQSGKMPAEAVEQSLTQAAKGMEDAVRSGLEAAQKQGVPGADRVSPSDVEKIQEQVTRIGRDAGAALEVPKANVELFRKHEAEIRKYAMHGLAFIGL